MANTPRFVWVVEWDGRPTAVYGSKMQLLEDIVTDGYDIETDPDFEVTEDFIYADDYISAHRVELVIGPTSVRDEADGKLIYDRLLTRSTSN